MDGGHESAAEAKQDVGPHTSCSGQVQQPERPLPSPADRYNLHRQRKDLQRPRRH
jgi:hypothetical protein